MAPGRIPEWKAGCLLKGAASVWRDLRSAQCHPRSAEQPPSPGAAESAALGKTEGKFQTPETLGLLRTMKEIAVVRGENKNEELAE